MSGEPRTVQRPGRRAWVTLVAAIVFFAAGGTLVGAYLAMPSDGVWALSVGTEMAVLVPLDRAVSVEALYRRVVGGALAGGALGALAGATVALLLARTLGRTVHAEATGWRSR